MISEEIQYSEIGDEIEMKTFFFRDHYDFGRKIAKLEMKWR